MTWVDVGLLAVLPPRGARVVRICGEDIAVFRTGQDHVFALRDRCPHRGGPLSQGIVHGERVTCPLHDWVIDLSNGQATGADRGCTQTFDVCIEAGRVLIAVSQAAANPAATDARAGETGNATRRAEGDDSRVLAVSERA